MAVVKGNTKVEVKVDDSTLATFDANGMYTATGSAIVDVNGNEVLKAATASLRSGNIGNRHCQRGQRNHGDQRRDR